MVGQALDERVGHLPLHEHVLESRAALAAEVEGARDDLGGRGVEVGVGENDRGVLGPHAEERAQAIGVRVLAQEGARGAGRPDEGQHVDEPALHHRPHDGGALAGDEVHDATREALLERRNEEGVREDAVARRLHHHWVAHDEGGDDRGEDLVHRVVVGAQAESDTERRPADAGHEPAGGDRGRGIPLDLPERLGRGLDVLDRAVELLEAVRPGLADLPQEGARHRLAQGAGPPHELEHAGDPLPGRGARPVAPASRPGARRRLDGLEPLLGARERPGPELQLAQPAVRLAHADRRPDGLARPVPAAAPPVDEQGEAGFVRRGPEVRGDGVPGREEGLEITGRRHVPSFRRRRELSRAGSPGSTRIGSHAVATVRGAGRATSAS